MDSSPATSIFKKPLAELSKRILHMRMELLDFRLIIVYIPGRRQYIADALSRHPTGCNIWPFKDPSTEWCSPHNKVGCNFAICYNTIDSNDPLLNKFYEAAAVDVDYMKIVRVVACGYKRGELRRKVDKLHPAFPLNYMWDTLRIVKDDKDRPLLFVEDHVFVPKSERIQTMEYLHLSHLGFANTFSIARSRYFWEGMKADFLKHIARCGPCIEYQDCRPFEVELKREQLISAPMEWIGADLFFILKGPIFFFWWMFFTIFLVPQIWTCPYKFTSGQH